jgi:hypothetical protein
MSISDPKYPAHAWQVDLSGDIDVSINGTDETIAIAGSDLWGFDPDGSGDSSVTGLAGYIASRVATHSLVSSATATWVTGTTFPEVRYRIDITASVTLTQAPTIKAATALARQIGMHGTPSGGNITVTGLWTPLTTSGSVQSTGFNDGVWAPNRDAAWEDVRVARVARQTRSPTNAGAFTAVSLGSRDGRSVNHRSVDRRYVTIERAGQTLYATQAGTDTGDTYSTLEGMVDAAVAGATFRLYRAAGDYTSCGLVWEDGLSTDDLVSSSSVGGRRVDVVIPYLDV